MSQSAAATMWDDRFRLPVPPVDAVSNVHVDMVATAIYLGLSALVLESWPHSSEHRIEFDKWNSADVKPVQS